MPTSQDTCVPEQKMPPVPSSPFPVMMVVAQHDFNATGDDEISFRKGETIVVTAKDEGFGDGWWTGRNSKNQIGLFPAVYTAPVRSQSPPPISSASTRPLSPEDRNVPADDESQLYEGLGVRPDEVFFHDFTETMAELSIKSSASSILSSETHQEGTAEHDSNTEDDNSSASSLSTNPIIVKIRQWNPYDVAAFIESRGFRNQAANFIHHEITGAILLELDLVLLKEVDIGAFGIRFAIMREIEGLKKLALSSVQIPSSHESVSSSLPRNTVDDDPESSQRRNRKHHSPQPRQFSLVPRGGAHYRRSSYEPPTPHSDASPRPQSMSPAAATFQRTPQSGHPDAGRSNFPSGHRSSRSQDSGFGGSSFGSSDFDQSAGRQSQFRRSSGSFGEEPPQPGRTRVDSQDSGLGHSRHTSGETIVRSPVTLGHKRQNSSLTTVRMQFPDSSLRTATGIVRPEGASTPSTPSRSNFSPVVLPGTRSESPSTKAGAKFLISPNSTRSPHPDESTATENGIRLVKSYSALRKETSSTSPTLPNEGVGSGTDLHHHRSVLLKTISAKEARTSADYCGWLRKRTERGASIPGISVRPGAGLVGGWKRRWFVLKGRRLSYYHSEKDTKEKGVIDITAHRCVTAVSAPNPNNPSTDSTLPTPARKISLTGSSKFIFKVMPPLPGASRAVTFTPQKVHIFSAENEPEFKGWVEALIKANIGLDPNAPTVSLARAKEMKSRPPALNLSNGGAASESSAPPPYTANSEGEAKKPEDADAEPKSPPLPTPPLAKENKSNGNFEREMEKALEKVGKSDVKSPNTEKKPPLSELSIPVGLQ